MNLKDFDGKYDKEKLCVEDKWILSKINTLAKEITVNIDNYDLGVATQRIYDFIWNEFCDWYIELVKTRLYDENCETRKEAQFTLYTVLVNSLKMLHPIMPFVTEEIYLQLPNTTESIMISDWPEYSEDFNFEQEENDMELLKDVIVEIRNIRSNMNVHPSKKSKLIFVTQKYNELIKESKAFLERLGFASEIIVQSNKEGIDANAISIIQKDLELYIPFTDLVDIEAEKERLNKEKETAQKELNRANGMLANEKFVSKAPQNLIEAEKEKVQKYTELLEKIKTRLKELN